MLERVLNLFPEADLYTHVYNPDAMSQIIRDRNPKTTFIDRLPASRKLYQRYLPLMPMALEELDMRDYDLILSFEAGPAKGVIAPPGAMHVCYCHSPMRYLWDAYPEYRGTAGRFARLSMPLLFPPLRVWDFASAGRVDGFIANSSFIQKRIRRAYRRESLVVHPPVPVEQFTPNPEFGDHYLWVGQMTPYKRGDLAVDAFNRLGLPLTMVGRGEMQKTLKAAAKPNISFIEKLGFGALKQAYANCKALVYTAEEDFGIIPVEAMAAGRPVIAFGKGGVLDSIRPGETGLFFEEQTADSLVDAVKNFERWLPSFSPTTAVKQAAKFSGDNFDRAYVDALRQFAVDHPNLLTRLG